MAVYTKLSAPDLRHFLDSYDLGDLVSFEGIAEGVENSNYDLHTEAGRYILTLFERRVDPEELPFFLSLMRHLAGRDIPCPHPVRDRRGRILRTLADRPACIVTFLEGRPSESITPEHCEKLGVLLARMHLQARDFAFCRRNDLDVAGWRRLLAGIDNRADRYRAGLKAELAERVNDLSARWPKGLPVGTIHADLFPDNVFFQDTTISGVIDFYFACTDALAYDLAVCLNAWCFDENFAFVSERAEALIAAYHKERALNQAELAALPTLAEGAAMRFALTRLEDWFIPREAALGKRKDPGEFLAYLDFHRRIDDIADYGFAV